METKEPTRSAADLDRAARRILDLSRRELGRDIPALMPAFYRLRERRWDLPGPMATDGVHLFYNSEQVVADFRKARRDPARQILHIVLHCLLGHLSRRRDVRDTAAFDLAADARVEHLARGLPGGYDRSETAASWLSWDSWSLPLPELYRLLQRKTARAYHPPAVFRLDDHRFWNATAAVLQQKEADGKGQPSAARQSSPSAGGDWAQLARDLMEAPGVGSMPGCLARELVPSEETGISYAAFLRRFLSARERMLADPDELDPRWYTLGLELYGDIPLLEPPEMSELPRVDDLVIALDTSGSCSGAVCRRFLRETRNLLEDLARENRSFRVLLLQCDAEIQGEVFLDCADQLEDALKHFTPQGFGGTDFRPVFDRIAQLRQEGALERVRGLLYLSDGCGMFPLRAPDYPTAFLIPGGGWTREDFLPDWVTHITLHSNDFTIQEASR